MNEKESLQALYREADNKFCQQFGFKIRDATFTKVANYLYAPKDPSSLAITRILFGLVMLFDIPDERGGAVMMKLWGDPKICHFPLIPILTSVGMPYMALVYAAMWVGALCIMLGYKFRVAAPVFTICYWYLFLIEKSFWNNHSYLYGLVALLLSCTKANRYWSLDTYLDPSKKKWTVPYWNYFILKYQFFILYFMAGCKKNSPEWLAGYSMHNVSEHWLFGPFKLFLTVPQTNYLVVHWFACVFDLTVALWMMCSSTRHVAMVFCTMFHLMNSRLFDIGWFPWVCLATMPLFCPFNWPKTLASYTKENFSKLKYCLCKKNKKNIEEPGCGRKTYYARDQVNQTDGNVDVIEKADQESKENAKIDDRSEIAKQYVEMIQDKHKIVEEQCAMNETELPETINNNLTKDDNRRNVTVYLIILYVFIQAFLPYSHFITKGYNNWTNGLYGYSWDMMIHNFDIIYDHVSVVDNDRNKNMSIDPNMYTVAGRWLLYGDMVFQLAHCLKKNLDTSTEAKWSDPSKVLTTNISIYFDIWSSLNERFFQRMFDPNVDILKATWSPFYKVPFLMPLMDEAGNWRNYMDVIRSEVHSWSENSDVEFFADFPGYEHKKYISKKRQNVTLTVLQGVVVVTPEVINNQYGHSVKLTKGNRVTVFPRRFNKVLNIGEEPAIYMYTFYTTNSRKSDLSDIDFKLPVFKELFKMYNDTIKFGKLTAPNMNAKDNLQALYREVDDKFCQQFGFKIRDATFTKVANYMYAPKDPSSLAVTRILFGLAMLFDIPDERGGADMMELWGKAKICHFPLIPILTSVGMPYMALVYAALWVGALCIMLGYKFRVAAPVFTICYWYLFLIERSFWNNHSYLFGLVALLLSCTKANRYWSLDTYLDPSKKKSTVPYWNYFILKYQFFILYFMAGCKKNSPEWLAGYSQQNLSKHWLFGPFKLFLTDPQTDYLVVHWFACVFDQTVALWMMCSSTRHVAMVFCAMFHLMNSQLFDIGLFPWVCLATMPLFCPFNWPKTLASYTKENFSKLKYCLCKKMKKNIAEPGCGCKTTDPTYQVNPTDGNVDVIKKTDQESKQNAKIDDKSEIAKQYAEVIQDKHKIVEENEQCAMNETELLETINNNLIEDDNRRNVTVYLIMLYVFIQAFLPYSHFITKGYNNWTNGMYGYSWDMMINSWDVISADLNVVDNDRNKTMNIDTEKYTLTSRWLKHGDMIFQLAHCLKKNLDTSTEAKWRDPSKVLTTNISIYVEVWSSWNERFFQRMFDPNVDILKATWSPFYKVPFLMPLLDEAGDWRNYMDEIRSDVHSWSENSDVEFFADFPGFEHENYISKKRQNITLTVLQGVVVVTPEVTNNRFGHSVKLTKGNRITVFPRMFNKVLNIGEEPAVYMYTFFTKKSRKSATTNFKLPDFKELFKIFNYTIRFGKLVIRNIFQMFKFSQYSS